MIKAIIYTSNTGHTAEYAKQLGDKINLPVYTLSEAKNKVKSNDEIIYMGWLMAGNVKGYKSAAKLYNIKAVCGVGMGPTGGQNEDIKKANALDSSMAVFTLQGGFDISKLHGIYKFMMKTMSKSVIKKLSQKTDRTNDEDDTLEMMQHGKSFVCSENLNDIIKWYNN